MKHASFYAIRVLPVVLVALVAHNLWRWRESSLYWRAAPYSLSPSINQPPEPTVIATKALDLAESSTVLESVVRGAEALCLSPTGVIYTGTANGELLELLPPKDDTAKREARIIGHFSRLLGIRSVEIKQTDSMILETLLVCDAGSGLLEIEVSRNVLAEDFVGPAVAAKKEVIISKVDDKAVQVCNGITFAQDRSGDIHVVFTDSSELPLNMLGAEVFAESGTGRVIAFSYSRWKSSERRSEADQYARVILDGLRFPNGVQYLSLQSDGRAELLVLECIGRALLHVGYNVYLGVATSVEADWVGTFHGDNIQPLRPRWPVGADTLPGALAPAYKQWGLSDLNQHLYLIGVPHCTSRLQETFLYSSSKLRKFLSSWVPLPIRLGLGNPVLFSNSAVAVYDARKRTIISTFKGDKVSMMKFTTDALVTRASRNEAKRTFSFDVLLGAFASNMPLMTTRVELPESEVV